mmetsp:Transcript_32306/g.74942  ORF Transcript_32306/g.74942 Transcript_32306/m.74942 type:complete len:201 (-) Transcript_32306:523-1125(-)
MSPRFSPSAHLLTLISTDAHFLAEATLLSVHVAQLWKTCVTRPLSWPMAHLWTMSPMLCLASSTLLWYWESSRLCSRSRSARSPLRRSLKRCFSDFTCLQLISSLRQQWKHQCLTPRLPPSRHLCNDSCTACERRALVLASCQNLSHARMTVVRRPFREPFPHFATMTLRLCLNPSLAFASCAKPSWILSSAFCRSFSSS